MKTLMLLRHAEAAAYASSHSDIDRPLAPGGVSWVENELAPAVKKAGLLPDHVFCSPALRTRETLALLWPEENGTPVTFAETIYNAATGDLFTLLQATPDEYQRLLLIGHNPGLHTLTSLLTGETRLSKTEQHFMTLQYRPGTLAVFDCPIQHWTSLQPAENTLVRVFSPGFGH